MLREINADIAVIGGSTGGCACALAALKTGARVVMTEETDWIGGQFTSQAVPADENPWIEKTGCTASYREFRERVKSFYKRNFPLTDAAKGDMLLNPGNGDTSRLSFDPRVALAVLKEMLLRYEINGQLTIILNNKPIAVETEDDKIRSVTIEGMLNSDCTVIMARFFIDATDCGELLPLSGTEYVTGAEAQSDTGEPHALANKPEPLEIQAITFPFAIDYVEGEDHTIERPKDYALWRDFKPDNWCGKLIAWEYPNDVAKIIMKGKLVIDEVIEGSSYEKFWFNRVTDKELNFWKHRRILEKGKFLPGYSQSDVTLVNWPQNDYFLGPIYEIDEKMAAHNLEQAKQLSLSTLYWLQTEAPRPDGGCGFKGLRLRKDVCGTIDGLSKFPYIRESRRIIPKFRILEQYVNKSMVKAKRAVKFHDSVGIGYYRIDLHVGSAIRQFIDIEVSPFQIPLGSLLPIRMKNLLAGCKNIGTTHITNGCYRLHPIEWNIGEAAGFLAGFSINGGYTPEQVWEKRELLSDFQKLLRSEGVLLCWPDDL